MRRKVIFAADRVRSLSDVMMAVKIFMCEVIAFVDKIGVFVYYSA